MPTVVDLAVVPGPALGPIVLGMSESDVIEGRGQPRARRQAGSGEGTSMWWASPSLRVDLDADGLVEFCEVTFDDGEPHVSLDGVDLLALPADEVAAHLSASLGGDFEESGYSFTCPSGLTLWRATLPEDGDANPNDRGGRYWRTVAVAAPGYW
jgi:hypothetical protein